jgi:sulfonate transport system permease protein
MIATAQQPAPFALDDGAVERSSLDLVNVESSASNRWKLPRVVRRAAGPIAFILIWQLLCSLGALSASVLVSPLTVLSTAQHLIADGELPTALVVSLHRVAVGAAVGIAAGTLLGLVAGLTKLGEDLVDSTMQMLRTVPFVGLIPLLIVWFGIGETPKYAIIALGTAFPMYLNVFAGIRTVDANLLESTESLGVSRLGIVRHVVLPAALPNAFVGLRYALGIAWIALIFAEQVNASSGIGYLMNNAEQYDQTNVIIVCLALYALLGLLIDLLVRLLERWLLSWRPTFEGH